jgi:glutathione reductase (NADPH)
MANYDVLVLGTGNAGMGAAGVARAAGKSVAMVESWDVGGTCPLRGCVPKKVLVAAAQVLHQIDLAAAHHIAVGPAKLDWAKLIERERGFVEGVPEAFAGSLEGRGIELIRGEAKFVGPTAVTADGQRIEAGKVVIATGSKPRQLPIPGFEHTITSDDILESPDLPESLVFIGGGVIALEFAHVYVRAGVRVTILEALPSLLPRMEADLVAELDKETRRLGVEVLTGVRVDAIEPAGGGYTVNFEHGGEAKSVTVAVVANGTGRVAHVENLDLDAAGIAHEGAAIVVDDYLRSTSNADVFVAGDALTTSAQLSPIATYEGRIAGHNALGDELREVDYTGIPACVFTVPALASVGLGEAEAAAQGLDFQAKVNDLASWRSSMTHAETASWSKVLVENGSGRILGAHMLGHGAEEVIHLFAFAIKHGIGTDGIGEAVFAYPTFASDIKHMI